jgi:penicillin-binding protein 1A
MRMGILKTSDGRRVRARFIVTVAATAILVTAAAVLFAEVVRIYREDLPSLEQLQDIQPSLSTRIYAKNGSVIQSYYNEKRVLVPFERIPKCMVNALLAAEDSRFYDHWGISLKDLSRAVYKNLTQGFGSQGASTITQQLARMLFYNREVSLMRKLKEALTAIKIERTYSKNEIIEMYLNQYWFGQRAYGIQAAAAAYFAKNAEELKIEEAALLAGILNSLGKYSPVLHPDRALQRRNYVLARMQQEGMITSQDADSLKRIPIRLELAKGPSGEARYFTEMVRQYLVDKYGEDMVYSGGLEVYTTIDPKLQTVAERLVGEHADSLQRVTEKIWRRNDPEHTEMVFDSVTGISARRYKQIQAAFIAIDNATGDIIALVGGKDFSRFKFNRAIQALRSPGSAFKPFVYTAAIENGMRPCDIVYDNAVTIAIPGQPDYRPHNFDNEFMGKMTMREAFAMSRNVVAIKTLQMVQPQQVIFYAQKMGIKSHLEPVITLAIGTSEVTMLDIVSAFTVFPNHGVHVSPRFVLKVTDRYGNMLEDNSAISAEEVLNPQTAYSMVSIMQSVVDMKDGTGASIRTRGFQRPAAGKTGTSDNFCDNWFIGYTPQITAGAWVGFDEKISIGRNQTGAKNGLPIWTPFMIAAHDSLPVVDFEAPDGIIFADICLESCELATDRCPEVRREVFTTKTLPQDECHVHGGKGRRAHRLNQPFSTAGRDTSSTSRVRF